MSIQGPITAIYDGLTLCLDAANEKGISYNLGQFIDLNLRNIQAVCRNDVKYSPTNVGAMVFSGVNSYLELPSTVLDNYSSGTICAWVNLTNINAATLTARQYNGTGTNAVFSIGSYPNSAATNTVGTPGKLYWHGKNGVNTAASNGVITANTNNFVCVTFNGSQATFYINGRYDSVVAGDYSTGNTNGVLNPNYTQIGTWNNNSVVSNPTSGSIYSLYAYNRVLTPNEILQNYDLGKSKFVSNTISSPVVITPTPSFTATPPPTPTVTPSVTPTITPTISVTPSRTPTVTPTPAPPPPPAPPTNLRASEIGPMNDGSGRMQVRLTWDPYYFASLFIIWQSVAPGSTELYGGGIHGGTTTLLGGYTSGTTMYFAISVNPYSNYGPLLAVSFP